MKWNHPPPTWDATWNWLAWFLPSTVSVNFDVSRYELLGEFSLREQPSCSVPWCECSVLAYTHQVEGRSVAWNSFVGNESSKSQCFVVFFWILHVFPKITSVSLKVLHRSWFHPVADATWPPPQGGLVTRFLVVFLMYLFEWAVIKSSLIWNRNPPNPLPAHNSLSIHMSVYMSIRQNYGKSKVVLSGLVVCRHSPNLHKR